jgi:molecular chaperone GrpE
MADQTYDDPALSSGPVGDETAADSAEASAKAEASEKSEASATAGTVEDLQREKDELKDRLLRTAAEFQNYRNRVERERRELLDSAAIDVLRAVLPIVDNFERALQSPSPPEAEAFRTGVELIHKQMLDLLRKQNVTPIESVGADFDPRLHQAVIHEVSENHREGEVMEELQRGYKLSDRLLRPAMVKVAKRS